MANPGGPRWSFTCSPLDSSGWDELRDDIALKPAITSVLGKPVFWFPGFAMSRLPNVATLGSPSPDHRPRFGRSLRSPAVLLHPRSGTPVLFCSRWLASLAEQVSNPRGAIHVDEPVRQT